MEPSVLRPRIGTVPVPNHLFDELLPRLTDSELRVLLVVLRATAGFRVRDTLGRWRPKQRDWISHGQLMKRTGRRSEAVSRAIAGLVDRGLLVVEDEQGRGLATAAERRRYVGRTYYRPVDMWKTLAPCHPAQPKTTRLTCMYNHLSPRRSGSTRTGWQRAGNRAGGCLQKRPQRPDQERR